MRAANDTTVTVSEAAELLSCHPQSVRRLIAAGRIPATRLGGGPGGHFRIPARALARFMEPGSTTTHLEETR